MPPTEGVGRRSGSRMQGARTHEAEGRGRWEVLLARNTRGNDEEFLDHPAVEVLVKFTGGNPRAEI